MKIFSILKILQNQRKTKQKTVAKYCPTLRNLLLALFTLTKSIEHDYMIILMELENWIFLCFRVIL